MPELTNAAREAIEALAGHTSPEDMGRAYREALLYGRSMLQTTWEDPDMRYRTQYFTWNRRHACTHCGAQGLYDARGKNEHDASREHYFCPECGEGESYQFHNPDTKSALMDPQVRFTCYTNRMAIPESQRNSSGTLTWDPGSISIPSGISISYDEINNSPGQLIQYRGDQLPYLQGINAITYTGPDVTIVEGAATQPQEVSPGNYSYHYQQNLDRAVNYGVAQIQPIFTGEDTADE